MERLQGGCSVAFLLYKGRGESGHRLAVSA